MMVEYDLKKKKNSPDDFYVFVWILLSHLVFAPFIMFLYIFYIVLYILYLCLCGINQKNMQIVVFFQSQTRAPSLNGILYICM